MKVRVNKMRQQKRVWQKLIIKAYELYLGCDELDFTTALEQAQDALECGDDPLTDAFAITSMAAGKLHDTKLRRPNAWQIAQDLPERMDDLIHIALSYDKKIGGF